MNIQHMCMYMFDMSHVPWKMIGTNDYVRVGPRDGSFRLMTCISQPSASASGGGADRRKPPAASEPSAALKQPSALLYVPSRSLLTVLPLRAAEAAATEAVLGLSCVIGRSKAQWTSNSVKSFGTTPPCCAVATTTVLAQSERAAGINHTTTTLTRQKC